MPAPKLLHQPLNSSSKFAPNYKHSIRKEHGGFLRSELLHIMCQLAKCEFVLSAMIFLYGLFRPWYGTIKLYVDMCTIITVAGSTGILTCLLGFVALCKIRWKCMMIVYLVFSILSSVSYLLVLIFTSIWLGELEKLNNPLKFMTHVSILLLLSSVAIGVCFILTSTFICNFWSFPGHSYKLLHNVQSNILDDQSDNSVVELIVNEI